MKLKSLTLSLIFLGGISSFAQNKEEIKPQDTEDWSRKPEVVTPGKKSIAPSDAIVLFDGKDLNQWKKQGSNEPAGWKVKGKAMHVVPKSGGIETKQKFGDCQLHIEWMSPKKDVKAGKKGQGCGNSGIFLMDRYEVQVLNSFENETYYNGMASSIYKQHIPLVNATLKPGEWQSYDIIFTAPKFNADKTLKSPAYVTVILNGVLVQNHVEIKGPTVFKGYPSYSYHEAKAPIALQDHTNEVSYRNIWIREL
ncbi:3-keto-disaccharide hydrolase [Saccharicrinis sp. GN24d3]|uniref:3-keto-disaccharide hydrolase n=1 Tax=Saccharicrinis sp. GN24d3 TaxID=3458416 RepID=UPI004035E51E